MANTVDYTKVSIPSTNFSRVSSTTDVFLLTATDSKLLLTDDTCFLQLSGEPSNFVDYEKES